MTSLVDQYTIARFVIEDFPVEPRDEEPLRHNRERYALEDCLREVVDFPAAAARALELWRERRHAS